jgi:hypothetical protein
MDIMICIFYLMDFDVSIYLRQNYSLFSLFKDDTAFKYRKHTARGIIGDNQLIMPSDFAILLLHILQDL